MKTCHSYINAPMALSKWIVAIVLVSIFILSGCSDDNGRERIEILTISSKLVPTGTNPQTDVLVNVMKATSEKSKEDYYLALGRIEGFEYIEGYGYRLKVLIIPIENPPMDGYTESFKLIEILSKKKED